MFFKRRPVVLAGVIMVCVALLAGSAYLYFLFNVRQIFNARISALTNRHVQARHIQAGFPAVFLIDDLLIEGMLSCRRAKVAVDLISLFGRDVRIQSIELDFPVVQLENKLALPQSHCKIRDQTGAFLLSGEGALSTPVTLALPGVRSVIVSSLIVREGVFKIKCQDVQGAQQEYWLEQVQLRAERVPLTDTPAKTDFFMTATLMKINAPFVGNFLKVKGWLNWYARDMEAAAQVVDDDGRIGLEAKFLSRQNDMQVSGKIRLTPLQGPQAVGKKVGMLEDVVLNALISTDTVLDLGFSFQTKMDQVMLEKVNLSGEVTTGLNSLSTSGNIVAGLEALGAELFKLALSSL